jgi:hypothetical protein
MRIPLLITVLSSAAPALAQVHTWTNSSGGDWNTAANWSPSVPNAATHNAILSASGTYTISLNTLTTLQGLQGPNPNVTLDLLPGGQLHIRQDGIIFPGTIRLLGTSAASSGIVFEVAALLSGPGGRIVLQGADSFGATFSSSATVTIDSGFTISGGRGSLTGPRINNGLIVSEGPNNLILDLGGTTTNNTTIKAVPGGRMQIRDAVVSQSPTAEILSDGGIVDFLGNTIINGGIIRSTNNGAVNIITLATTITFNGVSLAGPINLRGAFAQVNSGGMTVLGGSTLIINSNQTESASLNFANPGTLNGPGTALLNGTPAFNATISGPTTTGVTLGPTLTVAGTGRLHGRVNVAGRLAPGPMTGGVGLITFNNALVMQPTGILDLEVASSNSLDVDRFANSTTLGDFTAGGTLRIRPIAGFVPTPGLSWVLIQADTITGSFATLDLPPPSAGIAWSAAIVGNQVILSTSPAPTCYPDCDGVGGLTANDFQCFLTRFVQADTYANCDNSTTPPVLSANDFVCFLNSYVAGCS